MKYIKTYEMIQTSEQYQTKTSILNVNFIEGRPDLIPGYMYREGNANTVGYIGYNGTKYPLLCLIFNENYRHFIDWIGGLGFDSMNISIKDYIIQNNLIDETLIAIKKMKFSSGPSGTDNKLIKSFENQLLSDKDIQLHLAAKKYNL